ncbi:E3 ubiquitin-protein ligase MBR1-like [Salvia hispanica]|uniref:E3 ubiquitin-protein ligase MBR1-like n=1 Tax=Salvia hispanica TaxID=49212 RepID=UPI00200991F6|nr:E3 ubiquitin-protein ligase MBR1-like [Salvia hispanica]
MTMMYGWDQAAAHGGVTLKVLHFQGYDVVVRLWSPQSDGHVDLPEDDVLSGFRTRRCDDTNQDKEKVCCICLDDLYRVSVTSLDCRHEFHPDCIRRWLVCGENFCPLCKAQAIK